MGRSPRASEQSAHPTPAAYRVLDIVIALCALIITAPLFVLACLVVRLESQGPAIFRQTRLGRHKRPFTVLKFRTMRDKADPTVHREYVRQLVCGAEDTPADCDGNLFKLVADDRVTRIGRLLRQTSIDELPQLINVLLGQMSVVGPRPVLPYEAEIYPSAYDKRFHVRPGLTGLWQVNGRSKRTYREMVMFDIEWVERRSLRLYLAILLRTPFALGAKRAA